MTMRAYSTYQIALMTLIGIKRRLNLVVVGANDGKNNDPIYEFAMSRSDVTKILLIEPNTLLTPYLLSNYSSHPSHQVANCAIGEEGMLTLYVIKQDAWDRFRPAYAQGWPAYRAATGLTSAIKSHLEKALAEQSIDPESAIETLNIPAKKLKTLLDELKWPVPIDVLQIDAEGYDDVVIFNSNLDCTRPTLIHFENHNMPRDKHKSLKKFLSDQHYSVYDLRGDSLAVDGRFNLTSIALNLIVFISCGIEFVFRVFRKLSRVAKGIFAKN